MGSQPAEESGNRHEESAAKSARREFASARCVVRGRPPKAEEPGGLFNRQGRPARKLIDPQLRIVLHVGTSVQVPAGPRGGCNTAGAAVYEYG